MGFKMGSYKCRVCSTSKRAWVESECYKAKLCPKHWDERGGKMPELNESQLRLKGWLDEELERGELSPELAQTARRVSQKLSKGLPLTEEELVDVEDIVGSDKMILLTD